MPVSQRRMLQEQLDINMTRIALLEKRIQLSRDSVAPVAMDEARDYQARKRAGRRPGVDDFARRRAARAPV